MCLDYLELYVPKGCSVSFWKNKTEDMYRRVRLGQGYGDFKFPRVVQLRRAKGCSVLESETVYCVLYVFRRRIDASMYWSGPICGSFAKSINQLYIIIRQQKTDG